MHEMRPVYIITLFLLALALFTSGCERTIEEEVVQPIEKIYSRKGAASLETAVANVRMVRSALMRYPAISSDNLYPQDVVIFDYDSLKDVLADANLPADMGELLWDQSYGIRYVSDGYTFTFEAMALSGGKVITATPSGVTVGD